MQVAAKKWETKKYFKHIFKFLRVGSEMTPAGTARVNHVVIEDLAVISRFQDIWQET